MSSMRWMKSISPELVAAIEAWPPDRLRDLVRGLVLATAAEFDGLDAVRDYRARISGGAPLACVPTEAFLELHAALESKEMELDDAGAAEADVQHYFRQGRYAYALSLAAGPIDIRTVDNLLYDMGHAFEEPEAFWELAQAEAKKIHPPTTR